MPQVVVIRSNTKVIEHIFKDWDESYPLRPGREAIETDAVGYMAGDVYEEPMMIDLVHILQKQGYGQVNRPVNLVPKKMRPHLASEQRHIDWLESRWTPW